MTLPDERYRADKQAEQLLMDLCDPTKTPRVPTVIRQRAAGCLRHYPGQWDWDRVSRSCPEVFESPNKLDDLQVWIVEGVDSRK